MTAPTQCKAGTYTNAEGQSACSPAPPGFKVPDVGASTQEPCDVGTYSGSGESECTPCDPGTYQNDTGATECKPCEPGSYCPRGASAPLPCKEGTYSSATDLASETECTPTDEGFYASTGSTAQTKCSPGTVAPTAGLGVCLLCQPGEYQPDSGATACLPCAPAPRGGPAGLAAPLVLKPTFFELLFVQCVGIDFYTPQISVLLNIPRHSPACRPQKCLATPRPPAAAMGHRQRSKAATLT